MTINFTHLLKAALAMLTLGLFAITVAAPVTLDGGLPVQKVAYAKKGADDAADGPDDNGGNSGPGGGGADDAPDGPDDNGGNGADDAAGGADDDGTADQGPGDL